MWIKLAILVVLCALVTIPLMSITHMGFGRHFHKHHPGNCTIIKKEGKGSEDFQILSSGITFITSGVYLPCLNPAFNEYGKLYGGGSIQLFDMNYPELGVKKLVIREHRNDFNPYTFRPHGLSVIEDAKKGEHIIYAVNHVEEQVDRVEKFIFVPQTQELRHVKSIFSNRFRLLNDLVAISEDKLYISNWLYFSDYKMRIIEHLYQLAWGGVLFYDGTGIHTVRDKLIAPNGIILSRDQKFLYLSLPHKELIQVYKRGNSDTDLQLVQEVNIHTALDNFHLSEDGDSLYGGCHPIPYILAKYFSNPSKLIAPSQVLRIPLKDGLIIEMDITEELYDHGHLISGSSTAAIFKNKLLIGSVIDSLVMCRIENTL